MAANFWNRVDQYRSYIQIDNPGLTWTTAYTVSAWFKPHAWKQFNDWQSMCIVSYGMDKTSDPANRVGWQLRLGYTSLNIEFRQSLYTGFGSGDRHSEWRHDQWTHVIACAGGAMDGRIYVNGNCINQQGAGATPYIPTTEPFRIGRSYDIDNAGSHAMIGDIAEVAFWNRALDPAEVLPIMLMGAMYSGGEQPVLYMPLREGNLTEVYGSGGPYTATIYGEVTPTAHPDFPTVIEQYQQKLDVALGARMPRSFAPLGTRLGIRQPFNLEENQYGATA